jgi:hypothetical protein
MWVGFQQFIEPGIMHVREVQQGQEQEEEAGRKERLLAHLVDFLGADTVKPEEVRLYLAAAEQAGWDWRDMYAEAVRRLRSVHPGRAALMPPPEDVAP